jgi:hypothetical protein
MTASFHEEARMRSVHLATRLLASIALILALASHSEAQNIGATLQGLITDVQKAVLPGVT